jgi:hypothetical protein
MCYARFIIFLILIFQVGNLSAQSIIHSLVEGKVCDERIGIRGKQLDCDYRIGSDFWLSIAGVGQQDANIVFMQSDFKGKFYGTVGVFHGCAIVMPGAASAAHNTLDLAFVSPKTGRVYADWPSCKEAR